MQGIGSSKNYMSPDGIEPVGRNSVTWKCRGAESSEFKGREVGEGGEENKTGSYIRIAKPNITSVILCKPRAIRFQPRSACPLSSCFSFHISIIVMISGMLHNVER